MFSGGLPITALLFLITMGLCNNFENFIIDEEVINNIFETNISSIKLTKKLNKSKTKTRILFLAPFNTYPHQS